MDSRDDDHVSLMEEEVERLRVQVRLLQRETQTNEQANAGLVRELQRAEQEAQHRHKQHQDDTEEWYAERARVATVEQQRVSARLEDLEAENRRLKAESQALWDERHAQMVERTRRLQRELDIAQAVAKLVPASLHHEPPPPREIGVVDAGQQEIIGLLRRLVEMVGGEPGPERRNTARPMADADGTMVSFPPEPLWPDAFRSSQMTTEDYARELGQEERE